MAALPPSNTARFWLDYSDGVNEHSITFRIAPTATLLTIKSQVDNFLLELEPGLHVITILGCRVAVAGSNVTNPTAWTGAATYGTGAMAAEDAPREVRFIGRSTDGREVSISVYGTSFSVPATFRITSAANATIADAILALANASALGVGLTISGEVPVWKAYASYNYNSYWEREARP